MKAMPGKFAGRSEEIVDMEKEEKVTRDEVENCIKILLKLAYDGLEKSGQAGYPPNRVGYPTCDLIACFLDANELLEGKFFDDILKEVVSEEYDWKRFQKEKIDPKLSDILDIIPEIEGTDFDALSKERTMSNVGVASTILTLCSFDQIYSNDYKRIRDEKKDRLIGFVRRLIKSRIPHKGWQYHYVPDGTKYAHTLPTWLSLLALKYVPEQIRKEAVGSENEWEEIKKQVKDWLIDSMGRKSDHCMWRFKPEDSPRGNPYNVVATAQAMLALHETGVKKEEIIKCAIEYIKDNLDQMKTGEELYRIERLRPQVGSITHTFHPGVSHCFHALLTFGLSPEETIMQKLLNEISKKIIPELEKEVTETNLCNYYAILRPILVYLSHTKPKIYLDFETSIGEFKTFIQGASSIIVVGEIDDIYAKLIPQHAPHAQMRVICRLNQNEDLLKRYDWEYDLITLSKAYPLVETINCVIVNEKKALLSNTPFEDTKRSIFYKYLEGEGVSDLVKRLEEILDIKIEFKLPKEKKPKPLKEEIKEIVGEKFPEQSGIMDLKDLENNQLKGILEYYKLDPEYSEAVPSSLGFSDSSRGHIQSEFATRGVIPRVFMNSALECLIKNEVKDGNLVMDESSAYLLLNSSKREENIKSLLKVVRNDLWVLSEVHTNLEESFKKVPPTDESRFLPITDRNIDAETESERYHLSENEKILITFTKKKKDSGYGIITNTWEVAKLCMVLGINVYSLVKFLDKDEETYKMFRIPVDLLKEV
jgi:hypothetical protein